jgi:hypothetical protein
MAVDSWDPSAAAGPTALDVARLCQAGGDLEVENFGLSTHEIARLAAFSRHQGKVDWSACAQSLTDGEVVSLIRLFTLAEAAFPAWEAGAQSPVVPLVALLKRRGTYPADLTRWIKANSENRFLPHGSLMDRL